MSYKPNRMAQQNNVQSVSTRTQLISIALLFLIIVGGAFFFLKPPRTTEDTTLSVPLQDRPTQTVIVDDPNVKPEDPAIQVKWRAIRDEWLQQAERIAQETGDSEAQRVVAFLRDNGYLVAPNESGLQFLEAGKNTQWVAILPLVPGDEQKGERWDFYMAGQVAAAYFLPEQKTLILKSHLPVSPTWKGILSLHEGHHAYSFIPTPYDWTDQKTFCYKERDTHAFQNRVMQRWAGAQYDVLLKEEVERLRAHLRQNKGVVGTDFPNRTEYNPRLDTLFGPAQSDFERNLRQTHFWMHACFSLLEADFKGDVENQKALFLRTLYQEDGVLQQ